jgi:anaerobic dimethyl sulfoxide reductase subunit B (iron-sulfur subunit)
VLTIEEGQFPDVFVAHLTTSCYHCADPACIPACPAGAITKRDEDGIVVIDREKCLGRDQCDSCLQVCTYDAPQFGAEANAKAQKCDLCRDRLDEGKPPICVAACPMRALDAGPLDALESTYGDEREAVSFVYSNDLKPSVIFKPKHRANGR